MLFGPLHALMIAYSRTRLHILHVHIALHILQSGLTCTINCIHNERRPSDCIICAYFSKTLTIRSILFTYRGTGARAEEDVRQLDQLVPTEGTYDPPPHPPVPFTTILQFKQFKSAVAL